MGCLDLTGNKQGRTKGLMSAPLTCCPRIASLPFVAFLISQQLDGLATQNTGVTQFVIWWSGKLTPAGRCFRIIKRSKSVPSRASEGISARKQLAVWAVWRGDWREPAIRTKPAGLRQTRGWAGQKTGATFRTGSHVSLWGWKRPFGLSFLSVKFLKALCFYGESPGERSTALAKTQN